MPTANKPIVFVTQIPNRRDKETGKMVAAVNIAPAMEFGEPRVLIAGQASFFATADLVRQLRLGLRDYNFARGDSIIALGDPAIIAATAAIVAERNKQFAILRWDNVVKRYIKVTITI